MFVGLKAIYLHYKVNVFQLNPSFKHIKINALVKRLMDYGFSANEPLNEIEELRNEKKAGVQKKG